jgi:hypothetical protein
LQPIVTESFSEFAKVMDEIKDKEDKTKAPMFASSIKEETILAMVEILNISQISPKLLDVVSLFMIQISASQEKNWKLIMDFCRKIGHENLT